MAGAGLREIPCADFVAGAAFSKPPCVNVVEVYDEWYMMSGV